MSNTQVQGGFGVILISVLLSLNVFSTMLLAELPGGNLANYGATGLFIMSVVLFGLMAQKQVWIGGEWLILMCWLMYAIIPAILSQDVESAMFKVLTVLQLAVWALAIMQAIVWRKSAVAPLLMYGLAVSGAYFLSFAGMGVGTTPGNPDAAGRVASTLVNANAFGAAAVMGLALCLIASANKLSTPLKVVQAVLTIVLVAAVFNSGSRTALVGMIVLLLGASWGLRFWNFGQLIKLLPSLLIFGVVAGIVFFGVKDMPAVSERVDGIFSLENPNSVLSRLWDFVGVLTAGTLQAEEGGESMSQRFELIKLGIDMLLQSNMVGIGLDNFRSLIGAYSHSNVIEVLVATGIVGFLLYYSIYAALLFRCFKILRMDRTNEVARMSLVALVTLSLMDIQHVSYDTKQGWLFLAIMIATVEVARRHVLEAVRIQRKVPAKTSDESVSEVPATEPDTTGLVAERSGMDALTSIEPTSAISFNIGKRASLPAARRLED